MNNINKQILDELNHKTQSLIEIQKYQYHKVH